MRVIVCEPGKFARGEEIENTLEKLQSLVGGDIQIVYPFEDMVCLVCNEEGKLNGLPLNRALTDPNSGDIYDIVAGTFLICGTGEDDLTDLTDEDYSRYFSMFFEPEVWL